MNDERQRQRTGAMRIRSRIILLCAALSVAIITARADIAPTPRPGYSLVPGAETRVRMASEHVEIVVGKRTSKKYYTRMGEVTATFTMANESADTVPLDVAFPVQTMFMAVDNWSLKDQLANKVPPPEILGAMARGAAVTLEEAGYYDIRVSIDGGGSFAPEYVGRREMGGEFHGDYLWYHWNMSFPPGTTLVAVKYHIPSVYAYKRGYQCYGYVLHTGSLWDGPIGSAVVTVRFPPGVEPVLGTGTTWGYKKEANTVTWTYHNFEPGPRDDITIAFMPPDASHAIDSLKEHIRDHPMDDGALVELARIYIDVDPAYAGMAERWLQRAVEINKANTLAWNVHLLNYHRMHTGFGPGFYQRFEIGDQQRDLIMAAHAACPNDEGIALWYRLITPEARELPDTLGYLSPDTTNTRLELFMHWGFIEVPISAEAVETIDQCYEARRVAFWRRSLLLLRSDVRPEDRRAMLEVLASMKYFTRIGAEEIRRYDRDLQRGQPISVRTP